MVSLIKRLTSNHTVSCLPPTLPPVNTTIAPKNRTKVITPKWKLPRPEYFAPGLGFNRPHRKPHNSAHLSRSMYTIVSLCLVIFFL